MKYIVEYFNTSLKKWVSINKVQSDSQKEAQNRIDTFTLWDTMSGLKNQYRITTT